MAQSLFFSSLRDGISSLRTPSVSPDDRIEQAAVLVKASEGDSQLGFFRRNSATRDLKEVAQVLAEHGQQLAGTDTEKVFATLKQWDQLQDTRRRFSIQCGLSILVLIITGLILMLGSPSPDSQKTLFGLIGTVIGYWLR